MSSQTPSTRSLSEQLSSLLIPTSVSPSETLNNENLSMSHTDLPDDEVEYDEQLADEANASEEFDSTPKYQEEDHEGTAQPVDLDSLADSLLEATLAAEIEAQSQTNDPAPERDPSPSPSPSQAGMLNSTSFAGVLEQALSVVVRIAPVSEGLADYNLRNPFSKKHGLFREFAQQLTPLMIDLSNRELFLLTDNVDACTDMLINIFDKNLEQATEAVFGENNPLDFGFDYSMHLLDLDCGAVPALHLDTVLTLNFPALAEAKSEATLTNLLIYFGRLADSMPKIEVNLIFGLTTAQLVHPTTRPVVADLLDRVASDPSWKMVVTREADACGPSFDEFDLVFTKSWNA